MLTFLKNDEGIHLMSPVNPEFTLCGDAFDVDTHEPDIGDMQPTDRREVTCRRCAEIIKSCRRVRIG